MGDGLPDINLNTSRKKIALVVGCGSVGKRHIENLIKCNFFVIGFDKKTIIKNQIKNDKFLFIKNLNDLNKKIFHKISLAVISTWGPSHYQYFRYLNNKKIKHFVIEKPLCSSEKEADLIILQTKKNKSYFVLHHRRTFDGTQKLIDKVFKKYKETPNNMVVHGGASCLVTNGVHYLDLASNIFNSTPKSVKSEMKNSELNPRSSKLGFWEGYINYKFNNSKKLYIINSNQNKSKDCVIIYSQNIKMVIENGYLKYFYIKKSNEKKTNLYYPKFKKSIKLSNNYYKKMISSVFKEKSSFNVYRKQKINLIKSLLAALWSSKIKSEVKLNMTKIETKYKKKWPVS